MSVKQYEKQNKQTVILWYIQQVFVETMLCKVVLWVGNSWNEINYYISFIRGGIENCLFSQLPRLSKNLKCVLTNKLRKC